MGVTCNEFIYLLTNAYYLLKSITVSLSYKFVKQEERTHFFLVWVASRAMSFQQGVPFLMPNFLAFFLLMMRLR